jgi:hypothetical protein
METEHYKALLKKLKNGGFFFIFVKIFDNLFHFFIFCRFEIRFFPIFFLFYRAKRPENGVFFYFHRTRQWLYTV